MAREDREKLTDQLAKGEPLFARRVNSFEEAHPSVKSLRVEVTETRGLVEALRTTRFTEKNFRDAVNCSNPRCYGGGAFLGLHISYMAEDREPEKQITERCRGYEGSLLRSSPNDTAGCSLGGMDAVEFAEGMTADR